MNKDEVIENLTIENHALQTENDSLKQALATLKEQLTWLKNQIFGKRSERHAPQNDQQLLLPGFEELQKEAPPEEIKQIPAHTRRRPQRNGQDAITLPEDLPVKTTVIDIPEKDKICPQTGIALVKVGETVTQKLAHEPGSYYIRQIIRPKYAHPQREEQGILIADLPSSLLLQCKADESFLAELTTKKFVDHLPLYRVAEALSREGIHISRKLLSQWVVKIGLALKPLYNQMLANILSYETLFIDETPVKLQAKGKCKEGYIWVMVGGKASDPPYRVYTFYDNRCHANAQTLLNGYQGIVHSDKYDAYRKLAAQKLFTWAPCWSHIRRKFFEAEMGDRTLKEWMLRKIKYLFMLDRIAWERNEQERLHIRQTKAAPVIDEMIDKVCFTLTQGKLLPKSKLRSALNYFYGLIPYLKNYLQHPFARLDNNVAERAVRPIAIGRKNWMFFGSPQGAQAGAILLSLAQTCRGLGINPRLYLEDVFRRLMDYPSNRLNELLPDQWRVS